VVCIVYCSNILGLTPGNHPVHGGEVIGRFERDGYFVPSNRSSFEEIVGYSGNRSVSIPIEGSYGESGWAKSGQDNIS